MKKQLFMMVAVLTATAAVSQPKFSKPHGLYDESSLNVTITPKDASAEVFYTTDGSTPTTASTRYTAPLTLKETTLLRAIEVKDGASSAITTASYILVSSVLSQPNNPVGYPTEWGQYAEISGTAKADYEMDPEMTNDPVLRPKIIEGLKQLPILSVVTDKDHLFSHENNEETGGIYIFTGPPVGDPTGNGWTRQCSAELFGGPQNHDLTIDCGLKLHGGHGRLAEKNPKHSFRLQFKKTYGPSSLDYPLFGKDGPRKFGQLVLRCHFGNSWQHWLGGNRQAAQYTRDMWIRQMQLKMSHTGVNGIYVHLFLNGMYWGLYNIAERVDDTFGKEHFGGKKGDYDVLKIEEDLGNQLEASEGTLDAWNEMMQTVNAVAGQSSLLTPEAAYEKLDTLLDKDNFIDYMILNQYAGNGDWDYHNWYAIRRNNNKEGFKFLCWDSEIILGSANDNIVTKRDGYPTTIFHLLMTHEDFARRYLKRAKELLAPDGLLGQQSVVQVWDSLYNAISSALYDEAARWGDYRRDVHRWADACNTVYTVDNSYMAERNRLLTQYFPQRSTTVLSQIQNFAPIDDFIAPDNWVKATYDMFHWWDNGSATAKPTSEATIDWNLLRDVSNTGVVAGLVSVDYNLFADISQYDKLVIRGNGGSIRVLVNRIVPHGEWKEIAPSLNASDPYWNAEYQAAIIPLADFKNKNTSSNNKRVDSFVHLHAMKANGGSTVNVKGIYLIPEESPTGINTLQTDNTSLTDRYYNLQGQPLTNPTKGIYIHNGKKVVVK